MGRLRKVFKKAVAMSGGGLKNVFGKKGGEGGSDRSDAAGQMIEREVPRQRQAGSGQIKFTGTEMAEA